LCPEYAYFTYAYTYVWPASLFPHSLLGFGSKKTEWGEGREIVRLVRARARWGKGSIARDTIGPLSFQTTTQQIVCWSLSKATYKSGGEFLFVGKVLAIHHIIYNKPRVATAMVRPSSESSAGAAKKRPKLAVTTATDVVQAGWAASIVASAQQDLQLLESLVVSSRELEDAARSRIKELKRQEKHCVHCGNKSVAHCDADGCDVALCADCKSECVECKKALCQNDQLICDFDDGMGGQGCGRPVCKECYTTTGCERDVGGCQQCFQEYHCPDCDICHGYC